MEMKSESHRRAHRGSASRAPGWRRSGDESYWELLMAEVEMLPRAPRPQSCIGGVGVEGWLQQLEKVQSRPSGTPVCGKVPPLSDRTVSMPTLHGGATNVAPLRTETHRRHPGLSSPYSQGSTASWYETPPGSEEELFTPIRYRRPDPTGHWETAHFRCTPRKEQVRISTLVPVRNGWLPIQRQAVVCDITCHAPSPEDLTCQDQFDPPTNTFIPPNHVRNNGFGHADGKEMDKSSVKANCSGLRTWKYLGQTLPGIRQASSRDSLASTDGDLPLGQECQKREREERRTAFFSDGLPSSDYNSMERAAPCRNALIRTASAPVPSRATVPPAGTERLSKTRMGFSSITAAAHRISRSPPTPVDPRTAAQVDVSRISTPDSFETPPANYTSKPVVRRRRASVIKVADIGGSSCMGETVTGGRPPDFRHSYAEGEDKENALSRRWLQSFGDTVGSTSPAARPEAPAGFANSVPRLDRSMSVLLEPEGGREKVYKSTLSLHLRCPSFKQALMADSGRGGSERPRRPLSFGGVVRLTDPSLCGPPDPALNQQSRGSPEKVSAYTPSGQSSTAGLPLEGTIQANTDSAKQDVRAEKGTLLHCVSQHPDASKTQEHGRRLSAESILALNAASVIANIKLQAQLKKMAQLAPEQDSKKPQGSESILAEDSGCQMRPPPEEGVVRRPHSGVGRKARPRPIHGGSIWPGSIGDPQDSKLSPLSLQEALELLRPDFISRSRARVQKLEWRARERRARQHSTPAPEPAPGNKRTRRTSPNPLGDKLCKLEERAATGREMQLRSKRNYNNLPEVKRKKEEEKKRVMSQTNRLRAELFKKKLLDQILQRNSK